jgi:hypothetical protein
MYFTTLDNCNKYCSQGGDRDIYCIPGCGRACPDEMTCQSLVGNDQGLGVCRTSSDPPSSEYKEKVDQFCQGHVLFASVTPEGMPITELKVAQRMCTENVHNTERHPRCDGVFGSQEDGVYFFMSGTTGDTCHPLKVKGKYSYWERQ